MDLFAPGLEFLRNPLPLLRPFQSLSDAFRMREYFTAIVPNQLIELLRGDKARRAALARRTLALASTLVVDVARRFSASHAGVATDPTTHQRSQQIFLPFVIAPGVLPAFLELLLHPLKLLLTYQRRNGGYQRPLGWRRDLERQSLRPQRLKR